MLVSMAYFTYATELRFTEKNNITSSTQNLINYRYGYE